MKADYPGWEPRIGLGETLDQIVAASRDRTQA
jgi:hypothetical protein